MSYGHKLEYIWNVEPEDKMLPETEGRGQDIVLREKDGDLTQSYKRNRYTNGKFETKRQHKNATSNFDYITIADRLRTVSWSNNSHPTCVVKRFTGNQHSH